MSFLLPFLILAQAVVSIPASPPAEPLPAPGGADRLSLVIADTVSETDPQRLCDQPDCTSLYLGSYRNAVVLAGLPVGQEFEARIEMGSPWLRPYRLAMIVEHRDGREPLVRAVTGFHERTGEGCFETRDTDALEWAPEGPGITVRRRVICVTNQAEWD